MKIKYLKFSFVFIISGFLVLGMQTQPAAQQVDPANNAGQQPPDVAADKEKSKYAPGRVIVKFKSDGPHAVNEDTEYILESKGKFKNAASDKSDSLDNLTKKHNVKRAKSVFIERHGLTTHDAREKQDHIRHLSKVRHQSRSQRAPKDATFPDLSNIYVLEVPPESDIEAIVQEFQSDPHVEYAQPDYIMELHMVPNDPYYSSYGSWGQNYDDLWGLKKIQAGQAWDITQGEGIVVAVVDTGLDYNHPDIAGNVWVNPCEDINHNGSVDSSDFNGMDDPCPGESPNGLVDDMMGWDYANNDNDPMDDHGHGTHVSGTIAAVGNNGIGIIGVAPKAKVMPLKGFGSTNVGSISAVANGIIYAAQNGADVINNSLVCAGACPSNPEAEDAVRTAYNLGAVVVFAAGNDNADVSVFSPQNMTDSKPIVVSASTPTDTPRSSTNFGMSVDVAAPGSGILSLQRVGTGYVPMSGTSMASPHAAGVAALVLANHPTFTNEEVRRVLRASADDVNSPGFDVKTGTGRLNAARAVAIPSVLPTNIMSPTNGATYSSGQTITIAGTASGTGFQQYELFYGVGANPSSWVSLGPVLTPVQNAILGTVNLDTLGLPEVFVFLQLVVTSTSGVQFEDITRITIAKFKQITTNTASQLVPAISGDRIVWQADLYNGNSDIYFYNLNTNTQRRITTTTAVRYAPAISGNLIVWEDYRNGNADIYLYDLSTNTERQITTNTASQSSPAISDNLIVWRDYRNGNADIYLYDLSTNTERQITTNTADQYPPAISGNLIVWQDYRNGNLDIYLYDLSTNTERQITTNTADQGFPAISGNRIVWQDYRNGNADIYLYDLSTNTERRITTNTASQLVPAISGDRIVWYDYRNGNADIYLYDLSTNTERQITTNTADQGFPAISGNLIVWQDFRNGNYDIYLYNTLPVNQPPVLAAIGNKSVNGGQALTFTVSATDPDGDSLTYSATGLPTGATFSDKTFSWTPTISQVGSYNVTFTVTDSWGLYDSETITITVATVSSSCGDDVCQSNEDYNMCPADCLPPTTCGDGFCSAMDYEDGQNCQPDCSITCGDGICTPDEGYMKCELDCPSQRCGDGFCSAMDYEDGQNCQPDCSITCGDGICTPDEGYMKCELDCPSQRCGDGFCSAVDYEDGQNCQPDCTVTCGDNICTPDEGYMKCERDCPSQRCGDGFCSAVDYEDGQNCQPDCSITCGDGICTPDEGYMKCELDCPSQRCGDGFCSAVDYEDGQNCQPDCTVTCGDNICTPDEGYMKCSPDCPSMSCGDGVCAIADGENQTTCGPDCRPPELASVGNKTVNEGEALTFTVTATDPTGDVLTYTADGLPTGATFNGQIFAWTPDYTQAGTHNVLFTVSDGVLADSEAITILVNNINQPPVLASVGSKTVNEGQPLNFSVSATDPDGDPLIWKLGSLPDVNADGFIDWADVDRILAFYGQTVDTDEERRADIYPNGIIDIADVQGGINSLPAPYVSGLFETATGTFRWTPGYDQAGNRNVTFRVSDGTLSASETIGITVINVNRAPVLVSIGNKTVNEGQLLTFSVSATDPDGDSLTYSATGLPSGASFSGQTFSWTPTYAQAGTYNVTFTVSDSELTASETVVITVSDVPVSDLIISSLSTATSGLAPGQSFSISNTVKNKGAVSSGSFKIAFSLSNDRNYGGTDDIAFSATRSVTSLAIGASSSSSTTLTVPSSTPSGSYYICAKADSANIVPEADEANNAGCTTSAIQVALFDLFMNAVSGPSAVVTGQGQSFTLSYSVTNQSTASANNFYVGLYLSLDANITTSDTLIAGEWITSLAGGLTKTASRTMILSTSISPGTYYLGAIADRDNRIRETNETNNARVGSIITVTSGADIVMNSAGAAPSSAVRGTTNVTFTGSLNNQGVSGTTTIYVGFYLSTDATITTSDIYIDRVYFTNVSPGSTYTASISRILSTSIPAGTYYVGAIADYTNVTKENNETNNARAGNTLMVQ